MEVCRQWCGPVWWHNDLSHPCHQWPCWGRRCHVQWVTWTLVVEWWVMAVLQPLEMVSQATAMWWTQTRAWVRKTWWLHHGNTKWSLSLPQHSHHNWRPLDPLECIVVCGRQWVRPIAEGQPRDFLVITSSKGWWTFLASSVQYRIRALSGPLFTQLSGWLFVIVTQVANCHVHSDGNVYVPNSSGAYLWCLLVSSLESW